MGVHVLRGQVLGGLGADDDEDVTLEVLGQQVCDVLPVDVRVHVELQVVLVYVHAQLLLVLLQRLLLILGMLKL